MSTTKKRSSRRPSETPVEKNMPPKRWQRTVLSIAEVAWEDGGRGACFNASEERSAVKKLAEYGYMKIGHSHRDEITAALTTKGHLLLNALRFEEREKAKR